jgi:hypothetical protein
VPAASPAEGDSAILVITTYTSPARPSARGPVAAVGRGRIVAPPVSLNCYAIRRSWRCGSGRRPPRASSCMRYATARTSNSRLRCRDASVL